MLDKAIKLALNKKSDKYSLCAIITDKKGSILSIGWNSYKKSHPKQAYYAEKAGSKYRIYLHAELHALIQLSYMAKPYAIYVARVDKEGNPVLAKPCRICSLAIKDAGIKRVYYTKGGKNDARISNR